MTRLEEKLLHVMTVRKWLVTTAATAILFGAAGWFGGRECLVHEFRTAIGQQFPGLLRPPTPEEQAAEDANNARIEAETKKDFERIGADLRATTQK